ncbi:hypothetical protein ACF1G0_29310 [Streptomyces sp. NPDC013953]|uniref:hypothetical protein n=1 Tax=Streptomyces sp. NPDC013953 TaxID=3364868 RepID=UPI0036FD43D9
MPCERPRVARRFTRAPAGRVGLPGLAVVRLFVVFVVFVVDRLFGPVVRRLDRSAVRCGAGRLLVRPVGRRRVRSAAARACGPRGDARGGRRPGGAERRQHL